MDISPLPRYHPTPVPIVLARLTLLQTMLSVPTITLMFPLPVVPLIVVWNPVRTGVTILPLPRVSRRPSPRLSVRPLPLDTPPDRLPNRPRNPRRLEIIAPFVRTKVGAEDRILLIPIQLDVVLVRVTTLREVVVTTTETRIPPTRKFSPQNKTYALPISHPP